jgi:hypothetical protein
MINPGPFLRIGVFYSHRYKWAEGRFFLFFYFFWRTKKKRFPFSPFPQKCLLIENQCFIVLKISGKWGKAGRMGKWGNGKLKNASPGAFF